jgi:thioredoxin reductase
MSDYLIREIKRAGNITVRPRTEVVGAAGTGRLQALVLQETSLPGVFAAGDVRPGSAKRVASAVGEGAVTVQLIHQHLQHAESLAGRGGTTGL